jgi:hypothetical protein
MGLTYVLVPPQKTPYKYGHMFPETCVTNLRTEEELKSIFSHVHWFCRPINLTCDS